MSVLFVLQHAQHVGCSRCVDYRSVLLGIVNNSSSVGVVAVCNQLVSGAPPTIELLCYWAPIDVRWLGVVLF